MLTTQDQPKPARSDSFIIPVVMALLELDSAAELARKMRLKDDTFLSKLQNDIAAKWPERRLFQIIEFLKTISPPIDLELGDFRKTAEEFITLIPQDHPRYEAARNSAGLPAIKEAVEASDQLSLLYGDYVRLFICRDPTNPKRAAVAFDNFRIERGRKPNEATITQRSYDFENYTPYGSVRLRSNIVEMRIDYINHRHPNGAFLARFPGDNSVQCILTMNLDIKNVSRSISARPMLFVRVSQEFRSKQFHNFNTALFKSVKKIMKKYTYFDTAKCEFVLMDIVAIDEAELSQAQNALGALQKEAAPKKEPPPA